ncbi:MAG: hypothetical protein HOV86_37035 [Thermoactinospora sp.]|nr:hypothetical protein [Thermoactinospora sp.]
MVRNDRKPRRLVVGEETYIWTVRHAHDQGRDCRETLTLRRDGTRGRAQVVFRSGEGRVVSGGFYMPSGSVATDGAWLNLHLPGTVRALLDEVIAGGWDPVDPTTLQVDGWSLIEKVAALQK